MCLETQIFVGIPRNTVIKLKRLAVSIDLTFYKVIVSYLSPELHGMLLCM